MTPELLGSLIVGGIGVGSAVYATMTNKLISIYKTEKADAIQKWEEARKQIHEVRKEAQILEVQNAELKLQTNFEPVREKLDTFMAEQREVNKEQQRLNSATLEGMQKISANQERLSITLVSILEKLVPEVPKDILAEQEQRI